MSLSTMRNEETSSTSQAAETATAETGPLDLVEDGQEMPANGEDADRMYSKRDKYEVTGSAHHHLYLRLFQGSAVEANEATSLDQAITTVLRYLCTELGWPVGHAYLANAHGALVSTDIWYLEHPDRYEPFTTATPDIHLQSGAGLAGRVLQTGKPSWILDLASDPTCPRREVAIDPPLVSGFAFPIIANSEIVAILELFNHEQLPADQELLTLMEQVGVQVGLVAERFRVRSVLEAVAVELERSNQDLEEFASIASHDLQEPLRKVQSFGNRLSDKHGHLLPEEGQLYLGRMIESAARMQTLINDLLVYSRVSAKPKKFEQVDLQAVVAEVTEALGDQISRTDGRIHAESLPTVSADPLQMNQLFQNLVSNALKFHRTDVPPEIHISAEMIPGDHSAGSASALPQWRITVSDNGIGFREKQSERIFKMFERLHGRGGYEGTGIGLSICRKILERHGGTITAAGVPDQGTVFTIMLPRG